MPRMRKKKLNQMPFRLLAWVAALALALASWFFPQTQLGLLLQLAAACLFAVGAIWPRVFRRPYGLFVKPVSRWARRAWFF
jgi:hypothetical protein